MQGVSCLEDEAKWPADAMDRANHQWQEGPIEEEQGRIIIALCERRSRLVSLPADGRKPCSAQGTESRCGSGGGEYRLTGTSSGSTISGAFRGHTSERILFPHEGRPMARLIAVAAEGRPARGRAY